MERFFDWTLDEIEPAWVGFIVFISSAITVVILPLAMIYLTNGWILLAVPLVIVYAWYISLFKQ